MRVERELMRGAGPVAVLKLLEPGEMLYNLEAKKLIGSRWRRAESNRRRRYYSLTDRGRERLAAERGQWKSLVRALTQIGVLPDTATASGLVESAQ